MKKAITFLAAFLLAGCSGAREGTKEGEGAGTGQDLKTYEADFRPSDHDPAPGTKGSGTADPFRKDSAGTSTTTAAAGDQDFVQGFRVQIYSTASIDAAKAKKGEAESLFPGESLYVQYDPPAYKIRVGNFHQRYEADRFVRLAIEKGFPDSWTVPERVLKHPPRH